MRKLRMRLSALMALTTFNIAASPSFSMNSCFNCDDYTKIEEEETWHYDFFSFGNSKTGTFHPTSEGGGFGGCAVHSNYGV